MEWNKRTVQKVRHRAAHRKLSCEEFWNWNSIQVTTNCRYRYSLHSVSHQERIPFFSIIPYSSKGIIIRITSRRVCEKLTTASSEWPEAFGRAPSSSNVWRCCGTYGLFGWRVGQSRLVRIRSRFTYPIGEGSSTLYHSLRSSRMWEDDRGIHHHAPHALPVSLALLLYRGHSGYPRSGREGGEGVSPIGSSNHSLHGRNSSLQQEATRYFSSLHRKRRYGADWRDDRKPLLFNQFGERRMKG